MKKKIIRLEVFDCNIHIVLTDDMNKYLGENNIPKHTTENIAGLVVYQKSNPHEYHILFPLEVYSQSIVHESVHCINKIFLHRGIRQDFDNDESYAYHVGWLADEIFSYLDSI